MGARSRPVDVHPLVAKLRPLREEKGWTGDRLARAVGLSTTAISSYECGSRQPPIDVLCHLYQALGHELLVVPAEVIQARAMTPQRMAAQLRVIADRMEAIGD